MNLNRYGREVYGQEVTLDPAASGTWEATFDLGTSWIAGTDLGDGSFGWLVAGPLDDLSDADPEPDYVFPDGVNSIRPVLRLKVGNEHVTVDGSSIDLY